MNHSDLKIKTIFADGGPVLHRFRARAFGRAAPIRRRSAHISVILTDGKSSVLAGKKPDVKSHDDHSHEHDHVHDSASAVSTPIEKAKPRKRVKASVSKVATSKPVSTKVTKRSDA